ncbi:MAG: hypothetical protein NPIRA04_36810 [Nitrospirales bacterium]|nr:MAG: hypothetical protein NPIRA04_36810 [Nitrospirales bacterium]
MPDAHLVALLKQHDVKKLYAADSDFRKFSWLDDRKPFSFSLHTLLQGV